MMRYLLVAKCIKCQAPISKNAGCRHMTCTRCKAEFCWICRKEYRGHRDIDFRDIRWTLGCDILIGDTAMSWLCIMSMHFFVLPFWVLYYSGLKTGLFLNWLCFKLASLTGSFMVVMLLFIYMMLWDEDLLSSFINGRTRTATLKSSIISLICN